MFPILPASSGSPPLPVRAERQRRKVVAALGTRPGSMVLASLASLTVFMSTLVISGVAWANPGTTTAQAKQCFVVTGAASEAEDGANGTTAAALDSRLRCLRIQNHGSLDVIDFAALTRLTHLYIDNNDSLAEIRLPKLTSLKYLHISNNKDLNNKDGKDIIDLTSFPNLRCLNISNNENLHHIDLSNLTRLQCLYVRGNKCLVNLDLSNLINLQSLRIKDNAQLETLSLPDLGHRGQVSISHNNNLRQIIIPESTGFLRFHLENNGQLHKIELSDLANPTHWPAAHHPGLAQPMSARPSIRLAHHGPPEHLQINAGQRSIAPSGLHVQPL